jgi:filamentous hemagglutinin
MANPLKVLTDLIVSGSTLTSGSLTVGGNGGLTVSAGASAVQALTATTISGSGNLQAGGTATVAGLVTAQNGVTVTGAALNASAVAVSASALSVTNNAAVGSLDVGGGYGSTGVTVSSAGDIQANGALTVDGASTLTGQVTLGGDVVASNVGDNKSIFGTSTGTITVGASASTASFGGKVIVGGDLVVRGTTTSVDSITVNIGDKNINLGTGSTDLGVLSDGGLDLGTNAEVQWRYNNTSTAWKSNVDVDVASTKKYKINGTEVLSSTALGSGVTASSLTSLGTITSLTASALNVTGEVKLDGSSITLGNASSDVVTATGQLTASEGVAVASGKKVSLGGVAALGTGSVEHPNLGATNAVIVSYNGKELGSYVSVASSSGGPVEGTFVDISSSLQTLVRGNGIEGMVGGVTLIGGAGGVEITGEGAGANDINVSSANGGIRINAAGSSYGVYISSTSNTSGTLVDGAVNIKSDESYTYITKRTDLGFDTLNISGALKQLDTAINGMNGASVSPTEYYNVRTVVSGTKQSGDSTIVFTLSGSVQGQNGRTPNGSTITGLSASTPAALIQKLGGMSFDVAVRDMASNLWSNDLVSVQLSASALSNDFYWPMITVDAPAATTGAEIRLIAVNETANVIV